MTYLALGLLGPFHASLDGEPVKGLNSDYLRALLAYLAVESGREHARERLASLLWPERPDREALSALRYALSNLHGALGDRRAPSPFLLVNRTSVRFNCASDQWLDVAEFQELREQSDVPSLERAAALYRGPFLDGLSLGDSPTFEQWILLKGEAYRRAVLTLLGQLASLQLAGGEYGEVAHWARQQLALEPYREQAHRQLIMALALGGERAAALAHYEACRRLLSEELGCEPDDQTQALSAQIRDGTLPRPQLSPAVLSSVAQTGRSADSAPAPRFVVREEEVARLDALLERALLGHGGLALVAGEAGSGKTALLEEFARRAGHAHADLLALRGRCNAYAGVGDPYLPFREILQTLAGDVEGKRAGGILSPEQARRVWEALPAVGAALVAHGPDLIGRFVAGDTLLLRAEGFPFPAEAGRWQARLREMMHRRPESAASASGTALGTPAPQGDLFAQVTRVLRTVASGRPLLLTIDDLQWADGGTAALLFHLGRRLAGSRILLACAYRPEAVGAEEESEAGAPGVTTLLQELTRTWGNVLIDLDRADGRAFVEAYVDTEPNCLGAAFRQKLYDCTGGNPLFTVELLRSFKRQGTLVQDDAGRWLEAGRPDWARWPPQVEAVIAAHIWGLPDEDRTLLQAVSVQGEQFAAEVGARVLGRSEEAVVQRLSGPLRSRHRLVQAVSLDRVAANEQRLSTYRFRHALLQRSVYASLDAVARARLHEATGRALEAIYGPEGEQDNVLAPALAQHFEAAGMPLAAARYRLQAGRWAARLVAYNEAIAHLERGLALLEGVAACQERLRLELGLYLALAAPVLMHRGVQAPLSVRVLARLSELTEHPALQDDSQRLTALSVLALSTSWSADPGRAQRVGEQLLGLAQDGERQSLMLAHWALGHSKWPRGELVAAREHLGRALALYDPQSDRSLSPLLGGDPGVMAHAILAFVLWLLGYAEQGRDERRQALAQAQALEQSSSAAVVHFTAGLADFILGRDVPAAVAHASALRPLSQAGRVYGAWSDLLEGQTETGQGLAGAGDRGSGLARELGQTTEALSTWEGVGNGIGRAAQLLVRAQMLRQAGQADIALAALDQALAWIESTGMRILEAEIWRMRGELFMIGDGLRTMDPGYHGSLQGRPGTEDRESGALAVHRLPSSVEAEACFQRALEIADAQEARWLELRAAMSLARLWQAQGRRRQAHDLLAGIYAWFTEGFDSADLVEAKALLATPA